MAAIALQPALQILAEMTRSTLQFILPAPLFESLLQAQASRVDSIIHILGQDGWAGFPFVVLALVVTPAVCEELFFRATLLRLALKYVRRTVFPVVAVSILFTSIHPDYLNAPGIFLCSVLLGYSYLWSGNLLTAIVFHATSNLWNLFPFYFPEIPPMAVPQWCAVVGFVLAIVVLRRACQHRKKTSG